MAISVVVYFGVLFFCLGNSLRVNDHIVTDVTLSRSTRQTPEMAAADKAYATALATETRACRYRQEKTPSCTNAQTALKRAQDAQDQANNRVTDSAKPESKDFSRLMAWVSRGSVVPGDQDFDSMSLLLKTLLPLSAGLFLWFASPRREE
jgi:hypothetical protein